MPEPEHSPIGASGSARVIACPVSLQETFRIPPQLRDIPSSYAIEGTICHHGFADALTLDLTREELIGRRYPEGVLTAALVDSVILPGLELFWDLVGEEELVALEVERRVRLPNITFAFGTGDVIGASVRTTFVVDWKAGQGVPVKAVYPDGTLNNQLMFYLAGALHTTPKLFRGRKRIVIAIIQPRTDEPITFTEVTRAEVREWRALFSDAVGEALSDHPHRERGEWCRFAPCRPTCPLWTTPLLDLALLEPMAPALAASLEEAPTDYGRFLSRAVMLVDSLESMIKQVREQAQHFMNEGGLVPGFYLKPKYPDSRWLDDTEKVVEGMRELGFTDEDIWQPPKLTTLAQAQSAAKRLGVAKTLIDELRYRPGPNGTTIAYADDPAQPVERRLQVQELRNILLEIRADLA